ncbi:MAG: maleylpyruvate isomerase [Actinoplanes sp.]|nr:maleylpyruvate isomerase [Actinoplanes sp.]
MDPSLKDLTDQIDDATTLLLETAGGLSDDDARQPSLLPGWSRGHVLTHIARSGDVLCRLLDGARTGVPATGYASAQARDDAIEAGAGRRAAELTADVRDSAAAFRAAVLAMPAESWSTPVALGGRSVPASYLMTQRLVEIELHHVDLGAGYQPSDWPTTFNELELTEPMRGQRADRLV